jgi:hypothetical protein
MVLKTVHHNKTVLNTGNTVKCANSNYVHSYIRQGTVVKTVTASDEGEIADYNVDQADLTPGKCGYSGNCMTQILSIYTCDSRDYFSRSCSKVDDVSQRQSPAKMEL